MKRWSERFMFNVPRILCSVIWLGLGTGVLLAQNPPVPAPPRNGGLGVAPAVIEVAGKRGTTVAQTFTLDNSTSARVRFRCKTGDFWYDADNQLTFAPAGTKERSAALWVQFSPAEIIAEPNSSVTVKALVTIPTNARGGYYLTPIFEGEAAPRTENDAPEAGKAALAIELTGLMLVAVEDASDYRIEISQGDVTPPSATAEMSVTLNVANRGLSHTRMRGVFALLDKGGKIVGRGNTDTRTILPGQQLKLSGSWAGTLPVGSYTALVTLTYLRAGQTPTTLVKELPFTVS